MNEKLWILFSSLWPIFCITIVIIGFLIGFFSGAFWRYINIPKQKNWTPDFLLEGEELRVVRTPHSFPENSLMVIDYGYSHDVVTSNKDVVIYWKKSDYCEAKQLYEDQIMAKS